MVGQHEVCGRDVLYQYVAHWDIAGYLEHIVHPYRRREKIARETKHVDKIVRGVVLFRHRHHVVAAGGNVGVYHVASSILVKVDDPVTTVIVEVGIADGC